MENHRRGNRRWVVAASAVLVIVGGMVWHASLRVDEGPAAGTEIEGTFTPVAAARPTFRVAAFNIHRGKGPDGRRDLARSAECLRDVDLAGLNEVHGTSVGGNQAEELGRLLDRAWLFAPASRQWYVQQFGNAVLTRLPIQGWQRIPLPCRREPSHRNAILVVLEHQGRPVRVLLTHLTQRSAEDRSVQFDAVARLFLALEKPAILLGDLNLPPDDPLIQDLAQRPGVEEVIGRHDAAPPPGRVDWIFSRGLRCTAAGAIDNGASDHPLLWADFAIVETR
ncbi:MAG: endonuclease/exonuclease/phosphatase family protein [Pirellulales bacterium]|nr:endonuclease/exonuclease/phosphatase family protein [Pirellulales bacterium]